MAKSFLGRGLKFPLQINAFGGMATSDGDENIEDGVRHRLRSRQDASGADG